MCVLNCLALMFLLNLITFHIELKYKGLTTYEFLKIKENNQKESKIVVRVNQEQRDEIRKEKEEIMKLKKSQAELRKELERKAKEQALIELNIANQDSSGNKTKDGDAPMLVERSKETEKEVNNLAYAEMGSPPP